MYCLNCTNFGNLILRRIIKIAATRCHILKQKCTKLDFGWGLLLREGEGMGSKGRGGNRGEGWEREGKGGEETIPPAFLSHFKPWPRVRGKTVHHVPRHSWRAWWEWSNNLWSPYVCSYCLQWLASCKRKTFSDTRVIFVVAVFSTEPTLH